MYLSKLSAPIIPFTPLLLKDMTFAHEGNLTFIGKGMINFEKMVSALIWSFRLAIPTELCDRIFWSVGGFRLRTFAWKKLQLIGKVLSLKSSLNLRCR